MKEMTVKICVVGGGPAGYVAAIRAAQLGAAVALVEKDGLGGTCLNRGCIPTKALLRSAGVFDSLQHAADFGISAGEFRNPTDGSAIFLRKDAIVRQLRSGLEQLMKKNGITVIKGTGFARSSHCVEVENAQEFTRIHCEKLILALGSEPLRPKIPGAELDGVMTSDEALASPNLPKSMVIVGGGVIGLEFATYYQSMGCAVTLVEMIERLIPGEDADVSAAFTRILKKRGIKCRTGAKVLRINKADTGFLTEIEQNEIESELSSEAVLIAVGRKLHGVSECVADLDLKEQKGAILVDEQMRTNVEDVFAVGDVTGGRLLAHLAFAQARIAAENAAGNRAVSAGNLLVPSCIYTEPELASVGLNEQAAEAAGLQVVAGRFDMRANGRSLTLGNRDGFVKIVADKKSHVLLGGCILAPEASEMISELTLAITMKADIGMISDMIHPHPSLSEAVAEACADALGKSIHK